MPATPPPLDEEELPDGDDVLAVLLEELPPPVEEEDRVDDERPPAEELTSVDDLPSLLLDAVADALEESCSDVALVGVDTADEAEGALEAPVLLAEAAEPMSDDDAALPAKDELDPTNDDALDATVPPLLPRPVRGKHSPSTHSSSPVQFTFELQARTQRLPERTLPSSH